MYFQALVLLSICTHLAINFTTSPFIRYVNMTETLYSLVKVIATTELTQLWISCGQLEVNLQQPSTT